MPEKEEPWFEMDCKEIEREFPQVSLKNTDGWDGIATMHHKSDEQEIKGHNENIDTLLVFVRFLHPPSRSCPHSFPRLVYSLPFSLPS